MKIKRPEKAENVLKIARACIESGNYVSTFHADVRQHERKITLWDVIHVINTGHREPSRDQYKEEHQAWNYAIEGNTLQDEKLRVIISFDDRRLLVITVIKLVKNI